MRLALLGEEIPLVTVLCRVVFVAVGRGYPLVSLFLRSFSSTWPAELLMMDGMSCERFVLGGGDLSSNG